MKLMQRNVLIGLASLGSLALLVGAFGFQHLGGLPPCKLCIWQRYPHALAVLIGVAAVAIRGRLLPLLGLAAALTTAGVGLYHTGVERGWWEGPTTCTSSGTSGLSADDLFDKIMTAPVVRCDDVAWELLGLSMASWNGILSLGLAALWLLAYRRS
ncbi:disulfide bond formation protein B [Roseovarius nubinhibens]|jgi:disulfide bond formation protein DsbB|uniref:Disulfide bond formation protein, DsbB family protein n=1 Tax=Roseovarius nubinhibens (strain ATCC BAA-591 / DSM 15170 / ISM) TaxID=89187 RepID=A3SNQ3_ROSNI|nr:disulfide bond formation protein, DsbB family protein [Roseovarius nubinhibens ISM]